MSNSSRLWSRKEVADYLGVSSLTVLRMIQNGDLPAYKIKGQWKFKEEDVERHISERSSPAGAAGAASKKRPSSSNKTARNAQKVTKKK